MARGFVIWLAVVFALLFGTGLILRKHVRVPRLGLREGVQGSRPHTPGTADALTRPRRYEDAELRRSFVFEPMLVLGRAPVKHPGPGRAQARRP
jgi:hypothetical protein